MVAGLGDPSYIPETPCSMKQARKAQIDIQKKISYYFIRNVPVDSRW